MIASLKVAYRVTMLRKLAICDDPELYGEALNASKMVCPIAVRPTYLIQC
jgi:hypothetical protein